MPPTVALLTDFGTLDAYVAAMKGVILDRAPGASLVDITHHVPSQDVYTGAFLLGTLRGTFPAGTVFLCVVDPGVGTDRPALALHAGGHWYVGPDNGLFSYILAQQAINLWAGAPHQVPPQPRAIALRDGVAAYHIKNPGLFRHPVSRTFHGRDIFAPVAAHLAKGGNPTDVGPQVTEVLAYPPVTPVRLADGVVLGRVVHIDTYGNLITNLTETDLPDAPFAMKVGSHTIRHLSEAYEAGEPLLAIGGSTGYIEVASRGGSAAQRLGIGRWAPVVVRPG